MNLDVVYDKYFDERPVSTSITDLETSIVTFNKELQVISGLLTELKPVKRTVTLESIQVRRNNLDLLKNHIETMIKRLDTMQSEYVLLLERLLEEQ